MGWFVQGHTTISMLELNSGLFLLRTQSHLHVWHPQGLLPTSSIFCCRKKSYWEQRLDLPSLSFPQSQAQCTVLSIRIQIFIWIRNVIQMNNVSIYSRSDFLSMSHQNPYLSAAIDHSHHQLMGTIQDSNLWFWESTKCKSLSALQLVFRKDAPWSFYVEAWQQHLKSAESQLTFIVLLAFCCLISAVAQLCLTLCNAMDCSMSGFPVCQLLVCSNSSASSWWCYPTISPSVIPFSSCIQIFPSIRVFFNESVLHIKWPKYWSFSFSINPLNIQDLFPLGFTSWISLQSKGLSRVFSNTIVQRHQFFSTQLSL